MNFRETGRNFLCLADVHYVLHPTAATRDRCPCFYSQQQSQIHPHRSSRRKKEKQGHTSADPQRVKEQEPNAAATGGYRPRNTLKMGGLRGSRQILQRRTSELILTDISPSGFPPSAAAASCPAAMSVSILTLLLATSSAMGELLLLGRGIDAGRLGQGRALLVGGKEAMPKMEILLRGGCAVALV